MSVALDVAISLSFLYLLLALLVTTVQELLASFFRLRAHHLYDAIDGMLKGGGLSADFFKHPLITNLVREPLEAKKGLRASGVPSYIPSKTFALALVDVLKGKQPSEVTGTTQATAQLQGLFAKLPAGDVQKALLALTTEADRQLQDLDKQAAVLRRAIETWFNDRMARASGWYKRKAQFWSFMTSALVTGLVYADTVHVVRKLWHDANLRESLVAAAQAFHSANGGAAVAAGAAAPSNGTAELAKSVTTQGQALLSSGFPVGWAEVKNLAEWNGWEWASASIGLTITAFAVSLGAAFWFDMLTKALTLRGSGTKVSATTGRVIAKGS
jgi:hypothetical protein